MWLFLDKGNPACLCMCAHSSACTCMCAYVCALNHVSGSETLQKIALIPRKNYIGLTFRSSKDLRPLQLPVMPPPTLPVHLTLSPPFSSWSLSCTASKSTSHSMACQRRILRWLSALAAKSPVTFDDFKRNVTLFRIPQSSGSPSKVVWRCSSELWLWICWTRGVSHLSSISLFPLFLCFSQRLDFCLKHSAGVAFSVFSPKDCNNIEKCNIYWDLIMSAHLWCCESSFALCSNHTSLLLHEQHLMAPFMLLLLSISFVCSVPSSFYFILYLLLYGAKAQTQGPPLGWTIWFHVVSNPHSTPHEPLYLLCGSV